MFTKDKKLKIFDSDALKNFHKRIFFSIIVFLCFYFLAIFRIADVMLFDISENKINLLVKDPDRGKIYDRNGHLLSTNVNVFLTGQFMRLIVIKIVYNKIHQIFITQRLFYIKCGNL